MLKKLFKESLVYGVSRYIGKFIGVFLLPIYTAVLQPSDYGILDLLATISLVSSFLIIAGTDAAFGYYFFRKEFDSEKKLIISTALWIRLMFSSIVFLIILFGSSLISQILFGTDYRLFVIVTGVTIAFNSIYFLFLELLRFEIKPWLYTIVSSASILLNILLTIYFVVITRQGVYGAIIASSIAYSVSAAAGIYYIIKRYGFKFSYKWFKNITKYGYPLIGTGIAIWILTSTDRYFLAHYSDLSAVGIYAVGMKIAALMGMIAGAFQMAWGPFSMEIQYEPNAKRIYASIFFLFALLGIAGIFYVSMFAIDILKVFTQPSYYSAKAVVPFLCLSTVLSSAYFLVVLGMNLTKKLEHTIWITAAAAIINLVLNYLLTPKIGAVGAACSIMIANLTIVILTLRISQKFYYVRVDYLKIIILAVPAAVIIAFSYYFELKIIPRIILSFLYFIFTAIFVYKSFKHTEELKNIIKKISNFKQKFST